MIRAACWIVLLVSLYGCKPESIDMGNFPTGVTNQCRAQPTFIAKTGLGRNTAIDSRQQGYTGLQLINVKTGKTWRDPTWDDAGHIGAFERDRQGNIYVAPAPEVSLEENPPELQNRIYKIDAQTGKLALFMELPYSNLPSANNPFGIMGLSYDCNTDSLYASSLAGSTPTEELGRIYQINLAKKQIVSQLDNTDSIGVGVFNTAKNKRLYYGSARASHAFSITLDAQGRFTGEARYEFSLATLQGGNNTNVRKIQFKKRGQDYLMIAKEIEFGFHLNAANEPFKNKYIFTYQSKNDKWKYQGAQQE